MSSAAPQPAVAAPPIISVEKVSRVYRMGEVDTSVLREIDLEVIEGEMLVIVGPSGSGKSTLLNIMGAVDRPTSGRVRVRDHWLDEMTDGELTRFRREHVGFIFQFYNLVPTLTAMENVQVGTEIGEDPMDPGEALARVGLAERADHFPSQLSGGEQQRVAVARAIAKNPEIMLCDEPTGALDFTTGRTVLEILAALHRELRKTIVIITHNAPIAAMADRMVRLRSGQVVEEQRIGRPLPPSEIEW